MRLKKKLLNLYANYPRTNYWLPLETAAEACGLGNDTLFFNTDMKLLVEKIDGQLMFDMGRYNQLMAEYATGNDLNIRLNEFNLYLREVKGIKTKAIADKIGVSYQSVYSFALAFEKNARLMFAYKKHIKGFDKYCLQQNIV